MLDRRHFIAATMATACAALPLEAQAQVIDKPARLVVGFPPGGSMDAIARVLVEQMQGYAPSLIVDNKPGAAGRIALEQIKSGPADGTALIIVPSASLVLYPHVYKKLGYNSLTDFAPVTSAGTVGFDIAVGPKVPDSVKTIQDFVAWCKANPKDASYGSSGAGSGHHFVGAMFARAAGLEMVHVPYRGAAPAVQDLLAGQIASNVSVGAHIPLHQAGKVRILATAGAARSPFLPDVPTFTEAGYAVEVSEWFGVVVAAGTPPAIIDKLNGIVRAAVRSQQMQDLMKRLGTVPGGESPPEFAAMIKRDFDKWSGIVTAVGFTAEE
jgi:tripartite-type tricarboxylate transporter receptor subunit TctC